MSCSFMNPSLVSSLSDEDRSLCESLADCGQKDVLSSFTTAEQITNFLGDIKAIATTYPGGIAEYVRKAKKLIQDSAQGVNPFEGYEAKVPSGINLNYEDPLFTELENLGEEVLKHCAFALVGGGIGERLHSPYIKLSLTSDLVRDQSFLEDYCSYFHAIEMKYHCEVPFAIMTSDGTNNDTIKLLEEHNYFGLKKDNVTIMKQNGVPALLNPVCEVATKDDGHVVFKPHGHGDIHLLIDQYNLPEKWQNMGVRYVIFFQDTNGLSMHGYAPLLGVSERFGYDFCSMAIVRRPGEKVGGICRMEKASGESLTCNVEYNQLEDVLRATRGVGDVANAEGNSDYPGNINLLCARLESYRAVLRKSHGVVQEFVNPKYTDATRSAFKAPVRLECMMQDYAKLLGSERKVGFVSLPRWICFSAVKNSDENAVKQAQATGYPESFFSGEEDIYKFYRRVLRAKGVKVGDAAYDESLTAALGVPRFPLVALTARGGLTTQEIAAHFGENVEIGDAAVLVIDGSEVKLENCKIEGAIVVRACEGAKIRIHDCVLKNAGWEVDKVDKEDNSVENKYALRGYKLVKKETRELVFEKPGEYDITCWCVC